MSLVSLHNIRIAFGGLPVLDDLFLDIHKGQRICVLGRNGEGKSTLLNIINGELTPDRGSIITEPGLHVSRLPQDVPTGLNGSVFEIVAHGAGRAGQALVEYHRLEKEHASDDALHRVHHELDTLSGWAIQTAAERVLDWVEVKPDLDFASLSGGNRRRVFLARALVNDPDLLLLDEPTNHLDLASIAWLENFLLNARFTVMFVTHDRRLLRNLATRIVELDRGRVVDWSCNYATFLERKQAVLDAEEKEWERFDKKLAQEEVWIRKGVKARRTRNEGRVSALIRMRAERQKRRERTGSVSMAISEADRSGNRLLEAENVSFSYTGSPLIRNFSLTLLRGDRLGIVGPNGCGKTTLLNLLLGKLQPQAGSIKTGTHVQPVYFDQLREGLDPEKSVWENMTDHGSDTVQINGKPRHIISYLQDFLFTSERAKTPVRWLSGGERHRLLLARLFTLPANLLVFDEPTNDLDAETLELLEEVLSDFPGTVIIVSHDREFLNNVVTSALIFNDQGQVKEYVGGYDDWERQLPKAAREPAFKTAPQPTVQPPARDAGPKKLTFNEKRELETLTKQIDGMEQEHKTLCDRLSDPAFFQKPGFVATTQKRIKEVDTLLAAALHRWEALETQRTSSEQTG
ncbi:MAG: ATP-binding cassette domain-containing protein [Fibrobacterota bacterium]